MTPKMLILDLDGTALVENARVREDDCVAARALASAGVPVTIATGRLFRGTRQAALDLGVRGSVAVMNGTELVDTQSAEVRYGSYLGREDRVQVRDILASHGLDAVLFGGEYIRYRNRPGLADYLLTWTPDLEQHAELTDENWYSPRVTAIAGCGDPPRVGRAAADIGQRVPAARAAVFTTWDGDGFVEVRAAGDDKGTAVHRLAAERGFTAAEVVVVGDWLNDLPMFRAAGLSFAMNGAVERALAEVDAELDAVRGQGGAVVEVARRVWGVEI